MPCSSEWSLLTFHRVGAGRRNELAAAGEFVEIFDDHVGIER